MNSVEAPEARPRGGRWVRLAGMARDAVPEGAEEPSLRRGQVNSRSRPQLGGKQNWLEDQSPHCYNAKLWRDAAQN